MSRKDSEGFDEISKRLDVLIRLSALNLVKDIKKQKDQIAILSDSGFQPKQIADTLRTTSNTVSVALNAIRKERAEKEGKKAKTGSKPFSEEEALVAATSNPEEMRQAAEEAKPKG
jgi:precorrin-6B methylase 1